MKRTYLLEVETIDNKHNENNIETYEIHFNSYEESLHLKFFKENGNKEEFLTIIKELIETKTKNYFSFRLKKKMNCLKRRFYKQEKKFYTNNTFKSFSTNKHYKNSNIKDFLLFDKDIFKDDLKNLRIKYNSKEDALENIFEHNLSETFVSHLSKFGYFKNKSKNIIYFDKWGSISLEDNSVQLITF